MPKQTKRRGKASASKSVQNNQSPRDKRLKGVAITIILALMLSLLVGALSVTPTPASASQMGAYSADQPALDTDGDGVENNLDTDIDGDGILNFEDPDIDGDGVANFDDGDPAQTNGFDSGNPDRPDSFDVFGVRVDQVIGMVWVAVIAGLALGLVLVLRALQKRQKK